MYVGLYKPFGFAWFEFLTANTNANDLDGQYWNGTSWVPLVDFIDRTKGFTRSNKIQWDREQDDWTELSIDGVTNYWVRFKPSADHDNTTEIAGIGIVFSNDDELKEEVSQILKYLPSGKTSFIQYHQSVVKDIVRQVNNRGNKKFTSHNQGYESIDKFDFLDPEEIADAAKWFALEKIYFQISDNTEDKYYQRYLDYKGFASNAFDLYYLTLDRNDDGKKSVSEKNKIERVRVRVL